MAEQNHGGYQLSGNRLHGQRMSCGSVLLCLGLLSVLDGAVSTAIRPEPPHFPPPPPPPPPGMNFTELGLRSFLLNEEGMPPQRPDPDYSYCEVLMEAPVPPPIDSVPWFCLCMHCKGTAGPKGDQGDMGLPGIATTVQSCLVQ
ncbi:UNVERIFIED_CONTAM: hypothetical protein FKN15_006257 [Acipenser sinensis]